MKLRPYDDREVAIIEEEVKAGMGWAQRVVARLDGRSLASVQTFASSSGILARLGVGRGGNMRSHSDFAQRQRVPLSPRDLHAPSRKHVSDRIPTFLADTFEKWRAG